VATRLPGPDHSGLLPWGTTVGRGRKGAAGSLPSTDWERAVAPARRRSRTGPGPRGAATTASHRVESRLSGRPA
jgi:hypothetical protein